MTPAAAEPRQPPRHPDAVLDACVLYPASVRGVLLNVAEQKVFAPAWSVPILREVQTNLVRNGAMNNRQWRHLSDELGAAFPGALVPEPRIRTLETSMPNDRKDRHVLAAAVASGAGVVVTSNLRDFRAADLKQVGVRALHPDTFLSEQLERAPQAVGLALEAHVDAMRGSGRWSTGQLLGHLKGLGRSQPLTPAFASAAERALGIRAVPPPPRPDGRSGAGRSQTRQSPTRGG